MQNEGVLRIISIPTKPGSKQRADLHTAQLSVITYGCQFFTR